jgi:hypothetical protein
LRVGLDEGWLPVNHDADRPPAPGSVGGRALAGLGSAGPAGRRGAGLVQLARGRGGRLGGRARGGGAWGWAGGALAGGPRVGRESGAADVAHPARGGRRVGVGAVVAVPLEGAGTVPQRPRPEPAPLRASAEAGSAAAEREPPAGLPAGCAADGGPGARCGGSAAGAPRRLAEPASNPSARTDVRALPYRPLGVCGGVDGVRADALVLEPEAGPSELGCAPGARGGRRAEPKREEEQLEERAGPALWRRRESVERDRPEGRLRARSAPGAHRAAGPAPSSGAACSCWDPRAAGREVGAGGVEACARGRFLPRTDFGAAGRPRMGDFCQKSRGDSGWGISSADQDRERVRAGRGLSRLPGGLSSGCSSSSPSPSPSSSSSSST